ncbi:bifunctional oligoribonuclease/PAP phosphatase NrnA [bacterium]|nr:bifunctional oligoribonuclease/PAP phosphatase NrnA [bacterium]
MYKEISDILKNNEKFLIVSHANPDGDAIGSMLALGDALRQLKKKVHLYNVDKVPANLEFLNGSNQIKQKIDLNEKYNVGILVDCAQPIRVSQEFFNAKNMDKLICIDHHEVDSPCCDANVIKKEAAATAELVYELLKDMKATITKDIANDIFCGLSVDTGSFRYQNTSAYVFKILAELVELGADPWLVASNLDESIRIEQLKLLREVLGTVESYNDDKFVTITISQDMFKKAGATLEMCEEFINFPRSIKSVEVAGLFREKGKDEWKVSLRSKSYVNLVEIVKKYDGGGHFHAAGCTIKGDLASVKLKILKDVKESL